MISHGSLWGQGQIRLAGAVVRADPPPVLVKAVWVAAWVVLVVACASRYPWRNLQ